MDSRAPRLDRRTPRFLTVRVCPDVPLVTRPKQNKDIPPGERLGYLLWPGFHPIPALGFGLSRDPLLSSFRLAISASERITMSSAAYASSGSFGTSSPLGMKRHSPLGGWSM